MATPSKLILYGCLICPYVQRVRTALEFLKVPYDYEEVDLITKQQNSTWYAAINPCQKVPTIKHNNNLIFESLVILEYLEEVFGQAQNGLSLYPIEFDAAKRAHVRIWVRVFEDRVLSQLFKIYQQVKDKDNAGLKESVKLVQSGLKYVAKHSGLTERFAAAEPGQKLYFWGDKPSLGDFAILPNFNSMFLISKLVAKIDLFESLEETDKEHLQAFAAWYAHARQDPSFQLATSKVTSLPPTHRSEILAEYQWTTTQQWNYKKYFLKSFSKSFGYEIDCDIEE